MNPWKVLHITCPTLWICYLLVANPLWTVPCAEESFAGEEGYLSLRFAANPHGVFQERKREISLPFTGSWVGKEGEVKISGVYEKGNQKETYRFVSAQGRFEGELRSGVRPCEAVLFYTLTLPSGRLLKGRMKAHFCAS